MTGVAESSLDRLTPRFVARYAIAAGLLLGAHFFLKRSDLYQHPLDSALFYILFLVAIAAVGGIPLWRAIRNCSPGRIALFALMFFLTLPWGEWLKSDSIARLNWSHQQFAQALWIGLLLLFFRLFPGVAAAIRVTFVRALNAAARHPRLLYILPPAFFFLSAYIALRVYDSIPIIHDSASYLFQARIFSDGALFAAQPPAPDFFSYEGDSAVMSEGRWFSMYQPGYPAVLSLFLIVGAEWLLSPFLGALTLALWIAYAKRWHGRTAAVLVGLLFFISPFFSVMSAAIMAHPLELFLASVVLYLCRSESENHSWLSSIFLGSALLLGMLVRSFSLIAFLSPVLAFVSWEHLRKRKLLTPAMIVSGIVAGVMLVALYQWKTTGSPWVPGYSLEYAHPHTLGFGETVAGQSHTPAKGLENTSNNWLGINYWLTGWAGGSIFFLFAFLLLEQKFRLWDYLLLACSLSLIFFYFFYWFQDLVFGPRFWYLLVPFLLLTIARLVDVGAVDRPIRNSLTALIVVFVVTMLPYRFWNFVQAYDSSRYQAAGLKREIAEAGKEKLLVFLHPRISQAFVNWNDPFLRSSVILCRDLGTRNPEAMQVFPEHRPVYFRLVTQHSKNKMLTGYQFADEPDTTAPGYFSFFELSMNLQAGQYYPDQDIFDITYSDLFSARAARNQWNYLNLLEQSGGDEESYKTDFRNGLRHAARMLLLPRLAFLETSRDWQKVLDTNGFRAELKATRDSFEKAGEIGKPILEQLDKVVKRIDRNNDGALEDPEIRRFISTKTRLLL